MHRSGPRLRSRERKDAVSSPSKIAAVGRAMISMMQKAQEIKKKIRSRIR